MEISRQPYEIVFSRQTCTPTPSHPQPNTPPPQAQKTLTTGARFTKIDSL